MSTTRLLTRGVLALVLATTLASYGLATERDTTVTEPSYHWGVPPSGSQAQFDLEADNSPLRKGSRIVGATIKSADGTKLGNVHDLVLTPDLDEVSYVVMSRGGIFGLGRNLYAIPWTALSPGLDRTYVVQMTEQQLLATGGFDEDNWPSEATIGEGMQERAFTGGTGAVHDRRFTRIKGIPARTADDRHSGQIDDLVIATDNGRVAYTIISYGGLAGLGSRLAAVPHNAITLEPGMDVARINAPEATVKAYSFSHGNWPALADPSYSQQLAQSFGVEPMGTALGFVPAEEPAVAAAPTPRTERRPETRSAQPAAPMPPAAGAEPTSAELMGTFDPANITTIQGTVTDTGKFKMPAAPGTAEKDMLWLRVRTEDGQTTLVHLGPRDYISQQNFFVVRGDQIRLTGSHVAATAAGRRVFLPTELVYGDLTLRLRSPTGTGLWEGQAPGAVLGYTPAEERHATGTARPGREAERPMTEFAPTGLVALGAFDVANPRTIEGTVMEVGKSQVAGAQEVIWLRIKTSDAKWINVQVGPRDYVSRQNFFVVSGDQVRLTGWDAHIAGAPGTTPVFILADITHGDKALQLRNRSGEPLWTAQTRVPGREGTQMPREPMRTPETEEDDTDML